MKHHFYNLAYFISICSFIFIIGYGFSAPASAQQDLIGNVENNRTTKEKFAREKNNTQGNSGGDKNEEKSSGNFKVIREKSKPKHSKQDKDSQRLRRLMELAKQKTLQKIQEKEQKEQQLQSKQSKKKWQPNKGGAEEIKQSAIGKNPRENQKKLVKLEEFTQPQDVLGKRQDVINSILAQGNRRIGFETIKSFAGLQEGQNINQQDISNALKNLYDTELFTDIELSFNNGNLLIKLEENPTINGVFFEGNKRIDDDILQAETSLKPRDVYSKSKINEDVKRIQNLYEKSGRYHTNIVPKIIKLEQNRINLVYEIEEKQKARIIKINFIGNESFSDSDLRAIIATKQARWYSFFTSDDVYDEDKLGFDEELLRRHYLDNGFIDFSVVSNFVEYMEKKDQFIINFAINEGKRYKVSKNELDVKLPVEDKIFYQLLKPREGKIYRETKVNKSIEKIENELGKLGYAFVNVQKNLIKDKLKSLVKVVYQATEGRKVYVERINIHGNSRTLDKVIRRELRLAEGGVYNTEKLRRSRERLVRLGFFSAVDVKTLRGSADDKIIIEIHVKEKSTGQITFGGGFSSTDGLFSDVSLSERNFLGKGQNIKLAFRMSSVRQDIDLGFTEPYFLGSNFSAGIDLFSRKEGEGSSKTLSKSTRSYDLKRLGGSLRASYPFNEYLTHAVRYSYREDDITDVDSDASLFIKRQEGKNTTSLIAHSISYDKRDNPRNPKQGYVIKFSQDVAGIGGDARFFRNELNSAYYTPLFEEDSPYILKLMAKMGHVSGYLGQDVRINERFFIGGSDLRGFNSSGIGPRDANTKDALGGNFYATSSAEVSFPIGLPKELGVRGSIFLDAAILKDVDDVSTKENPILDEDSIRASAGFGFNWESPLAPIRIDFGFPIAKEDFDKEDNFRLSFGASF